MVWIGTGVARPYYTKDGGASWAVCNVGPNAGAKWINSYTFSRRICIADKNHPGTFYLYFHGFTWDGSAEHYDSTMAGVYKSTDGGANFTRICTVQIDGAGSTNVDYYNGKLKQVLAVDGDFLWAAGNNSSGLFRSQNSCASWSEIGSFTQVYAYGIGKALAGTSYPALTAVGYTAASGYGFYESIDGGASWVKKFTQPNNKYDQINDLAGDPGKYGRWAIANQGSGVDLIDYSYSMTQS
jgi:hypothetical protein